jgi:hypothetical protein
MRTISFGGLAIVAAVHHFTFSASGHGSGGPFGVTPRQRQALSPHLVMFFERLCNRQNGDVPAIQSFVSSADMIAGHFACRLVRLRCAKATGVGSIGEAPPQPSPAGSR